jgi:hypothetical protein
MTSLRRALGQLLGVAHREVRVALEAPLKRAALARIIELNPHAHGHELARAAGEGTREEEGGSDSQHAARLFAFPIVRLAT